MAIILSTAEPNRFIPADQLERREGERIAYLVRTPTVYDETQLRREVAAHGGRIWSPAALRATLRRGVAEILAGDEHAAEREEILAVLDRVWAAAAAGETAPAEDTARGAEIEEAVRRHYLPFAERLADGDQAIELWQLAAARLLTVGTENLELGAIGRGGLTAAQLERMPRLHIAPLALFIGGLMGPTSAEKKS